ncbi:MAG: hypothetical protein ACJKTH_03595 [Patescibacteria group bacterium UBA2163]
MSLEQNETIPEVFDYNYEGPSDWLLTSAAGLTLFAVAFAAYAIWDSRRERKEVANNNPWEGFMSPPPSSEPRRKRFSTRGGE